MGPGNKAMGYTIRSSQIDTSKFLHFFAGWKNCGSISLARTEDRLTFLKRQLGKARYDDRIVLKIDTIE